MTLRNEITLMNGKKANYIGFTVELLSNGSNDNKIKCICTYCKTAYKIRPFICRCASNVFLRNVENGKLTN
jgi:hypothetical protein